jgi:hypothetical protein
MAVLGNSVKGGSSAFGAAGRKFVAKFAMPGAGTLTELHGWFAQLSNVCHLTLVVYRDSAGAPGSRVAYTSPLTGPGTADTELQQTGFSVALTAGDYWLGWVDDAGAQYYYDASGTCVGITTGQSGAPPSDPFGAPDFGPQARLLSVWAVYTPAAVAATPGGWRRRSKMRG